MLLKKIIIYFLLLSLVSYSAIATHLKGGEISVKRISEKTLTFEFTLTTYTENNRANIEQNEVRFCFGDGSATLVAKRSNGFPVGLANGTLKNVYKVQYTYPAASLFYKVSVAVPNRNDGVLNMTRSVEVAFYVETIFSINAGLGLNSTPILLNPAVDLTAVVGQPFIHNANAVDAEGDSLAYRLSVSRTGVELTCDPASRGIMAPNFKQPNEVYTTVPSTFLIDSKSGDLKWNSPQQVGLYNCAFIIEEWRNGVKISETVRDMQIEVKDLDNKGPKITIPADVCVQAGAKITQVITAIDQASKTGRVDPLTITSTGNVYPIDTVYAVKPPFATFVSAPRQTSLQATGTFNWQTDCIHIRKEAYDVLFKVEDVPPLALGLGAYLVDSKLWKIQVQAPAVKNLKTIIPVPATGIRLTWDNYACALPSAKILVFRKVGDCSPVVQKTCETGMTVTGFVEIGKLTPTETSFLDLSVAKNINYNYILLVSFIDSKGNIAYSPLSNSSCNLILTASSIMTNVSVKKTTKSTGEIEVKWTKPIKLDVSLYPGPYFYQVQRVEGLSSLDFKSVGSLIPASTSKSINDTTFIDTGLNTEEKSYRYRTLFYYTVDGKQVLMDPPSGATNVALLANSGINAVKLSWSASVPWSNENKVHKIFREYPRGSGKFNQIANVPVGDISTFKYVDLGLDTFSADGTFNYTMKVDSSYCYYVETWGAYGTGLPTMQLFNSSQITCAKSLSDISPCPPALVLNAVDCATLNAKADCEFTSFTNQLSWTPTVTGICDPEIVSYKLYYAKDPTSVYSVLYTGPNTSFAHVMKNSFRGCYYVTAISALGKESSASEKQCVDNCASFELPNLFTPNGDGLNDLFKPMRCPRFVSQVIATIVDRNGQWVYQYSGPLDGFGWNGKGYNGNQMAASTYFYSIDVVFDVFDTAKQTKSLKGWVELVR